MRYSKKYIAFTLVILLLFFGKFNTWSDDYAEVETFRGAQLEDHVFYPLKAKSINDEGLLTLQVEDVLYGKKDGLLMGDAMEPLISSELAAKLFGCRISWDNEENIYLRHNATRYEFNTEHSSVKMGTNLVETVAPAEFHEDKPYLPLESLCQMFGGNYYLDDETYVAHVDGAYQKGRLPAKFDLREENSVSKVRDQKSDATCWAQAALSAVESTLLPEESYEFDVSHMTEENNFDIDASMGGEYSMALAYLLSWNGPVTQEAEKVDAQIGAAEEKQEQYAVTKHVQEAHFFEHDDLEEIKWAVYQTGGVSTSIYANVSTSNLNKSTYYNKKTNAYAYRGEKEPNHEVVIIGWDDNYSASNFSEELPGDGAFLCLNSWGASFGQGGCFYVSYYDANIGSQGVCYSKVERNTNYDNIYQSDLCGWVGQVGYNKEKITAANVYTAASDEEIEAVGFYALGKNSTYDIFIVKNFEQVASLANRVEVASGSLDLAGYYTIPLDHAIEVKEGEKFAVVLALTTPGTAHPMAIEYCSDDLTANVDITDGEGYISMNGLDWESVEAMASGNLCLKAYSKKKVEEIK